MTWTGKALLANLASQGINTDNNEFLTLFIAHPSPNIEKDTLVDVVI